MGPEKGRGPLYPVEFLEWLRGDPFEPERARKMLEAIEELPREKEKEGEKWQKENGPKS